MFGQIVSLRVRTLSNTNLVASRHIKREKAPLPVDVRRSKTSLLELPISYVMPLRLRKAEMILLAKDRGGGGGEGKSQKKSSDFFVKHYAIILWQVVAVPHSKIKTVIFSHL